MDTQKVETCALLDDQLDAVSGGMANDGKTAADAIKTQQSDFAAQQAAQQAAYDKLRI